MVRKKASTKPELKLAHDRAADLNQVFSISVI